MTAWSASSLAWEPIAAKAHFTAFDGGVGVSPMRTLIVTLGLCMALQPPPKRAAAVPNNLVCGTATRRAPAVPLPAKVLTPEQIGRASCRERV